MGHRKSKPSCISSLITGKAMGDEGKPTEPGSPNPQQRIDRCLVHSTRFWETGRFGQKNPPPKTTVWWLRINKHHEVEGKKNIFFVFTSTWGNDPKWVETTYTKSWCFCSKGIHAPTKSLNSGFEIIVICRYPYLDELQGDLRFQSDDGITVNLTSWDLEPYSWCAMSGFQPRQEIPHIDDKWSMMVRYSSIFSVYLFCSKIEKWSKFAIQWWSNNIYIHWQP